MNNEFHLTNKTSDIRYSYEELEDIKEALDESVILAVTDQKGIITAVNSRFCEISQYSEEELIGQNHRILNSGFHPKSFYKEMWKTIGNGKTWNGDICNRAKDGSLYWVQTTIVPFLNEKGKPYQYIAIRVDVTAQKNIHLITYIANHDDLTALPNRRNLSKRLYNEIQRNPNQKFALFYIDINRFRHINDALGHNVGDMFLVEVAERFRLIDDKGNSFYRINGDEFVYFLQDINEIDKMAQKIIGVFKQSFHFNDYEFFSSVCIGISVYPDHADTVENLFVSADKAMYSAKNKRGNHYEIYKENLQKSNNNMLLMETKLYNAIYENKLELHYQPKIDLQTHKMVGIEALLRWKDPDFGQVPPNKFIQFAEEYGLISDIGRWVLRKVANQINEWKDKFKFDFRVSVNISPLHFQEPNFIAQINTIIEETQVNPRNLEIEITEMSMMNYNQEVLTKIKTLKNKGFTISIDDFGTGYSSLSYLKEFPVDTLKIDRSFIVNMNEGESGVAMVAAIISLAHALKLNVVAEGVETDYELSILKNHNCEFVQGYYFSRPLSVDDFNKKIESKQLTI